jgi:hypothetical protein
LPFEPYLENTVNADDFHLKTDGENPEVELDDVFMEMYGSDPRINPPKPESVTTIKPHLVKLQQFKRQFNAYKRQLGYKVPTEVESPEETKRKRDLAAWKQEAAEKQRVFYEPVDALQRLTYANSARDDFSPALDDTQLGEVSHSKTVSRMASAGREEQKAFRLQLVVAESMLKKVRGQLNALDQAQADASAQGVNAAAAASDPTTVAGSNVDPEGTRDKLEKELLLLQPFVTYLQEKLKGAGNADGKPAGQGRGSDADAAAEAEAAALGNDDVAGTVEVDQHVVTDFLKPQKDGYMDPVPAEVPWNNARPFAVDVRQVHAYLQPHVLHGGVEWKWRGLHCWRCVVVPYVVMNLRAWMLFPASCALPHSLMLLPCLVSVLPVRPVCLHQDYHGGVPLLAQDVPHGARRLPNIVRLVLSPRRPTSAEQGSRGCGR